MAPATVQNRRYTGTYTQPLPYWPLRPACDWLPAPPSDVSPAKGTVGLNLEPGGGADIASWHVIANTVLRGIGD